MRQGGLRKLPRRTSNSLLVLPVVAAIFAGGWVRGTADGLPDVAPQDGPTASFSASPAGAVGDLLLEINGDLPAHTEDRHACSSG